VLENLGRLFGGLSFESKKEVKTNLVSSNKSELILNFRDLALKPEAFASVLILTDLMSKARKFHKDKGFRSKSKLYSFFYANRYQSDNYFICRDFGKYLDDVNEDNDDFIQTRLERQFQNELSDAEDVM
jgi:hypothetical protein